MKHFFQFTVALLALPLLFCNGNFLTKASERESLTEGAASSAAFAVTGSSIDNVTDFESSASQKENSMIRMRSRRGYLNVSPPLVAAHLAVLASALLSLYVVLLCFGYMRKSLSATSLRLLAEGSGANDCQAGGKEEPHAVAQQFLDLFFQQVGDGFYGPFTYKFDGMKLTAALSVGQGDVSGAAILQAWSDKGDKDGLVEGLAKAVKNVSDGPKLEFGLTSEFDAEGVQCILTITVATAKSQLKGPPQRQAVDELSEEAEVNRQAWKYGNWDEDEPAQP